MTSDITKEIKLILSLGFEEKSPLVFIVKNGHGTLFFDYQLGKRRSFAVDWNNRKIEKGLFFEYAKFKSLMKGGYRE